VLGGTAFADTITVDADDRAHRHRGEHRAWPSPRHLGVHLRRRGGGADEPNQSGNSSATPKTNTPEFIVIQRDAQQSLTLDDRRRARSTPWLLGASPFRTGNVGGRQLAGQLDRGLVAQ
jgi:hypothetical protein